MFHFFYHFMACRPDSVCSQHIHGSYSMRQRLIMMGLFAGKILKSHAWFPCKSPLFDNKVLELSLPVWVEVSQIESPLIHAVGYDQASSVASSSTPGTSSAPCRNRAV